jgi:hypothetical protein
MPSYSAAVQAELDSVEAFIERGNAAPMIGLCESAMRSIAKNIERCDDSDGYMMALMERIGEMHLKACEVAKPNPEALARQLFQAERNADYSEWHNTAERYAHVLGETGLAAFRQMAEAEWAGVPVRTERASYNSGEGYYRITAIMESLARQTGDPEQLVAVLERNLTNARQYERIAEIYREARDHDKALAWAERGMAANPGWEGAALRLLVAEEYQRRERHADALRMVYLEFRNGPTLQSYQTLEKFARRADDWDEWRDQALQHIRRKIASTQTKLHGQAHKPDHSLLVQIFLYERLAGEAWQEAQSGGCHDSLWRRLAEERQKTHPEEAVPVYLRLAEEAIVNAHSSRYEPAVELLELAAPLMQELGKSGQFKEQLDALRQKYKIKRNFQKLAEARRRFLYLS